MSDMHQSPHFHVIVNEGQFKFCVETFEQVIEALDTLNKDDVKTVSVHSLHLPTSESNPLEMVKAA